MQPSGTELDQPPIVLLIYCDYPEVDDPEKPGNKVIDWNGGNCRVDLEIDYHGFQYQHVGSVMHRPPKNERDSGHFTAWPRYMNRVWAENPTGDVASALKMDLDEGVHFQTPETLYHPKLHCYVLANKVLN